VYRRILGAVYGNEKGNWRTLANKEIHAMVKSPTVIETIRLNRLGMYISDVYWTVHHFGS